MEAYVVSDVEVVSSTIVVLWIVVDVASVYTGGEVVLKKSQL
jgi:hypothetical protein